MAFPFAFEAGKILKGSCHEIEAPAYRTPLLRPLRLLRACFGWFWRIVVCDTCDFATLTMGSISSVAAVASVARGNRLRIRTKARTARSSKVNAPVTGCPHSK